MVSDLPQARLWHIQLLLCLAECQAHMPPSDELRFVKAIGMATVDPA